MILLTEVGERIHGQKRNVDGSGDTSTDTISLPMIPRERLASLKSKSIGMGGQHIPVPVPQQDLVHFPDQLPVGEQRTGQALDRHVRAPRQALDLEVEAGGDEMPALLERNVLPCCLVAFGAEQLLVANIQDNLPISYYQVLQGDPQMLVGMQPSPAMLAGVGDAGGDHAMYCLDHDSALFGLSFLDGCFACHLVIWQM